MYHVMNSSVLIYVNDILLLKKKRITLIHNATTKSTFEINIVVNLIQNKKLIYIYIWKKFRKIIYFCFLKILIQLFVYLQ